MMQSPTPPPPPLPPPQAPPPPRAAAPQPRLPTTEEVSAAAAAAVAAATAAATPRAPMPMPPAPMAPAPVGQPAVTRAAMLTQVAALGAIQSLAAEGREAEASAAAGALVAQLRAPASLCDETRVVAIVVLLSWLGRLEEVVALLREWEEAAAADAAKAHHQVRWQVPPDNVGDTPVPPVRTKLPGLPLPTAALAPLWMEVGCALRMAGALGPAARCLHTASVLFAANGAPAADLHAAALYELGLSQEANGAVAAAAAAYDAALRVEPTCTRAAVQLAWCLLDAAAAAAAGGKEAATRAATAAVDAALASDSSHYEAWFLRGVLSEGTDDDAAAAHAFRMASRLRPTEPAPWVAVARIAMATGALGEAVQALSTAARVAPWHPDVWRALADAYTAAGHGVGARHAMQQGAAAAATVAGRTATPLHFTGTLQRHTPPPPKPPQQPQPPALPVKTAELPRVGGAPGGGGNDRPSSAAEVAAAALVSIGAAPSPLSAAAAQLPPLPPLLPSAPPSPPSPAPPPAPAPAPARAREPSTHASALPLSGSPPRSRHAASTTVVDTRHHASAIARARSAAKSASEASTLSALLQAPAGTMGHTSGGVAMKGAPAVKPGAFNSAPKPIAGSKRGRDDKVATAQRVTRTCAIICVPEASPAAPSVSVPVPAAGVAATVVAVAGFGGCASGGDPASALAAAASLLPAPLATI